MCAKHWDKWGNNGHVLLDEESHIYTDILVSVFSVWFNVSV